MTPAQAYGHPNFVTDVPVQGPTDEGLRSADCIQQQRLPTRKPACVDCEGPIPMWAQQSLSPVRGNGSGFVAEHLSIGGRGALGFALDSPSDPEIWSKLTQPQQMWVSNTLNKLNSAIIAQGSKPCPTWGPAINLAGGCFQAWYNANYAGQGGPSKALRTDGTFDEDTLCALIMIAKMHPKDYDVFPEPSGQYCAAPLPVAAASDKKLSTGAMVGIGVAGAAALGGIVLLATKKGRRGR